ncbi:unnamed protein product [Caenorhabditis auriculariae]|uniref:Uncharacterized protein n=1 Tax=Caenorhabditis auriculariae TaxID=2777116 RepID=A0A8S1GN98_9PELO|nr:unnamed protein product [Caenorhabditis auriculariae]
MDSFAPPVGYLKESSADKTVLVAAVFCGGIFLFICGFFFYLFKKKLERKKKKKRKGDSHRRQRQPYRQQRPVLKAHCDSELSSPATSRFVHHDATGIMPPIAVHTSNVVGLESSPANSHHQTFYG